MGQGGRGQGPSDFTSGTEVHWDWDGDMRLGT